MRSVKALVFAAAVAAGLAMTSLPAPAQTYSYYAINGQILDDDWQLYLYEMGVPPGAYWMDEYGNLVAEGYSPSAPVYGDPDWSGQASGDWNVISPQADYWVGGDGSGCIYTPDWSNC